MKPLNKTARTVLATAVAGGALLAASSAFAQGLVYSGDQGAYGEAHLMPVALTLSIGWHGDRYWDGHRYWAHDDWMHRHPHDPGPRHWDHRHDDHRR